MIIIVVVCVCVSWSVSTLVSVYVQLASVQSTTALAELGLALGSRSRHVATVRDVKSCFRLLCARRHSVARHVRMRGADYAASIRNTRGTGRASTATRIEQPMNIDMKQHHHQHHKNRHTVQWCAAGKKVHSPPGRWPRARSQQGWAGECTDLLRSLPLPLALAWPCECTPESRHISLAPLSSPSAKSPSVSLSLSHSLLFSSPSPPPPPHRGGQPFSPLRTLGQWVSQPSSQPSQVSSGLCPPASQARSAQACALPIRLDSVSLSSSSSRLAPPRSEGREGACLGARGLTRSA